MFRVKVVGTYIARSELMEKEKVKKSYVIQGVIPTTVAALSIVKNKLLGPALTAKYTDYVTFLTYNITEIDPLDDKSKAEMNNAEVGFMNREALLRFVKVNNVGACSIEEGGKTEELPQMSPVYYPDLFKLREAVQFAKDDPKGYHKNFALREADLRLDLEMAKCNPELFNQNVSDEGLIASVALKVKPAKASSKAKLTVKTEDRLDGLKADMERGGELGPEAPDVGDL